MLPKLLVSTWLISAVSAVTTTSSISSSLSTSSSSKSSLEYNVVNFENIGYEGYYYLVDQLNNPDDDSCSCRLSTLQTPFSGTNSPLNEELSVHFRGPLSLKQFAVYNSSGYSYGNSSGNSDWSRIAYYDASSQTSSNLTFLTTAGTNSTCLGNALTYAGSDGLSEASNSTILEANNMLYSNEEYSIFSDVACESSGYSHDCGVYREGIPAFHGFEGTTKMFLFEFTAPTESKYTEEEEPYNYDLPAIWLLNAHVPRTSQYSSNGNCSCWGSGCGEFDIFEVLNTTEATHFYSTIHDYQGTGDIYNGLQAYGWLPRDTEGNTMTGGVVFDTSGNAFVFMSDSITFGSTIDASDLTNWISTESGSGDADVVVDELENITNPATHTSGGNISLVNKWTLMCALFFEYFFGL